MSEVVDQVKDRWELTQAIFHEAVAVGEPERTLVLESRCSGDAELMEELRSLLAACEAEASHESKPVAQVAAARIGPYAIDHLLGRGGMGAVYLAQRVDGQFEQQVAIKVLDMPLATDLFRERFRAERQILAGLSHPYIARLLDGGVTEEGELYLAMEYVEGTSIQRFSMEKGLTIEQRLTLFRKVCEAVQYAHQNLIVHRDLKPDNILVKEDGTPRLLDFGTAKIVSPLMEDSPYDATRRGFQMFTPRYASPEQVLGQPITIASDTYSLGVLLYGLLTDAQPYELVEFTTEEMMRVIVGKVPVRPSARGMPFGRVDSDLDSIVLKALRKEPQARYTTVEQMSADVQAYLEHRPVGARRGSVRYRARKFVQRNKLGIAAAVLLGATLLAGVGGVLWQSHVANQQRRRAEARSEDLRELSNSLLSELDEALKDIPGSTGAQKLLVTRVLEHLDRMAQDAKGDRQTELDLIGAYTRLGNVQGNLYYQNVADTPGAVASINKALALAGPLAGRYPRDTEVLRSQAAALEARGEALSDGGDPQASASSLREAVRVYDRAISLPGVKPDLIFEAAIANETLGNELGEDSGLSDPEASVASYRKALEMDYLALKLNPKYMAVRRGIPVMYLHLGNVILETDPVEALKEFQTALQLQGELPEEQRQRQSQVRFGALLLRKQASAYCELGQYAKAIPLFADSMAVYRRLADADGKNVTALGDLQRILSNEVDCYTSAADPRLAEVAGERRKNLEKLAELLEQEAGTIRKIIELAPAHEPWKAQLASVSIELGSVRHALDKTGEDAASAAATLAVLRRFAEGPKAAASDIDLAVHGFLEVEPTSLRDTKLAVRWAEHGAEMTHRKEAAYLLLLAKAYRADGKAEKAQAAAREGLALLPAVQAGTPKSRLSRLLEDELRGRVVGRG